MPKKILKKPPTAQPKKDDMPEIDYLVEDPIISGQLFACVSFLKPSQIKEENRPKDITVCGFKIRGVFATYEEAQQRSIYLRTLDDKFNIYVAEVGKWCPFEDNPDKAKSSEYMNKDLNDLMKSYYNDQEKAKSYHELRKQEMVSKALKEIEEKKRLQKLQKESGGVEQGSIDLTAKADSGEPTNVSDGVNGINGVDVTGAEGENKVKKRKNKKLNKLNKLNEMKSSLTNEKAETEAEKQEINENLERLRRMESELHDKIRELQAEGQMPAGSGKVNL